LVSTWPATQRARIGTLGSILFCHATPRNDTECFTRLTPADRVRATRYPQAETFAANNVLRPPPEAQMLEVFSKMELT
jgi:hypothetical protein